MSNDVRVINEMVQRESAFIDPILHEVHKVVVGQDVMIERILIGLLTGGHILLEGVPGLAKTLTVNTICDTIAAKFQRIQTNLLQQLERNHAAMLEPDWQPNPTWWGSTVD